MLLTSCMTITTSYIFEVYGILTICLLSIRGDWIIGWRIYVVVLCEIHRKDHPKIYIINVAYNHYAKVVI